MRLPRFRRISGRIRQAGFIALVVIGLAFFLYFTPYVVDAARCFGSVDQPAAQQADGEMEDGTDPSFWQCLGGTYGQLRGDTNLAAVLIALAVALATWRPEERPGRWAGRGRRGTRRR